MSIRIGDKMIHPGEKVKGFVKAGEASTHDIMMPYVIVNSSEPGPTLCVLGGTHPLEYASIEGVQRVAQEIKPEELKGILVVVPVVNTDGFNARAAFNNPVDYVNQNRVFPGDLKGSLSRRVASCLFDNFVSKADALIDSHGGDMTEDIYKFVIFGNTDDEKLKDKMMKMALCYDTLYIQTSDIKGSTGEALNEYGIPCITPESGTPYPVREEEIEFHREGIINVMKYMKMLEGEPNMKKGVPVNPKQTKIIAERGGLWIQKVKVGERVDEGQFLGKIVNLFGDTLQKIYAPFAGIANNSRTSTVVYTGDTLVYVIEI
jgi:predicted deacylase